MKNSCRFVLIIAIIGYVSCQSLNDVDVDDARKALEDSIPGLDDLDIDKLNKAKLPKIQDVENVLREKCEKNGAKDAVTYMEEEQEIVKNCVESYVNFTVVEAELEEAKKTGSMDEVFAKYCKKWPSIYQCFDNVTSIARSCMDDKEKKAFNKSLDIIQELQSFMCHKDGDRLAMFVAEGGVECLTERKDAVQQCVNSTVGHRIPDSSDFSAATLPSFLFSTQDCQDFEVLRECINKELEKCKNSTPANIVDAFFKFLKKHLPCDGSRNEAVTSNNPNGSWLMTSSLLLVVASLVLTRTY